MLNSLFLNRVNFYGKTLHNIGSTISQLEDEVMSGIMSAYATVLSDPEERRVCSS